MLRSSYGEQELDLLLIFWRFMNRAILKVLKHTHDTDKNIYAAIQIFSDLYIGAIVLNKRLTSYNC